MKRTLTAWYSAKQEDVLSRDSNYYPISYLTVDGRRIPVTEVTISTVQYSNWDDAVKLGTVIDRTCKVLTGPFLDRNIGRIYRPLKS